MKIVLGIESSCDETAVALVREDRTVLAQALATQQAFTRVVRNSCSAAQLNFFDGHRGKHVEADRGTFPDVLIGSDADAIVDLAQEGFDAVDQSRLFNGDVVRIVDDDGKGFNDGIGEAGENTG